MKQIQTPKWGKPGNIAMMVPGGLLLLMGMGAFVFDLGYISLEKTRLQTTADSATAAASRKLNGTTQGITNARNEAAAVVALNDPQNLIQFDKNRDLVFGYWNNQTFDTSAPVGLQNAARINVERSVAHNNALAPMFSQIVGLTAMEAFAQSSVFVSSDFADPADTDGVLGGHFDVDTDHNLEPLINACSGRGCSNSQNSDGHSHEYDNEFNTAVYNARSPSQSSAGSSPGTLHSVQQDTVSRGDFKIIIANANLSPGVDIIVNGVRRTVAQYAAIPYASLPTFNSTSLTELKLEVRSDSFADARLHRTIYTCAWSNMKGQNNEWRNGSLTVQAISTTGTINTTIGAFGGQGVASTGMLHEIFMFWHAGTKCYSDSAAWEAEWDILGRKKTHFMR
jgi:Flp pilus assembly protein TadG